VGLAPTSTPGRAREIADAAVSLADAGGMGSVSLAAVAADLGLTTTALYRYVDSKDSLVAMMVDTAVGPPPELGEHDWRNGVEWTRGGRRGRGSPRAGAVW
jgi:AcrR family transcriptional regulator